MKGIKYSAFGALSLMALLLVTTTFSEKMYGSYVVQEYVYHSPLFIFLWAVTAILAIVYVLMATKRPAVVMLHLAFVLVLSGALLSFLTSRRGSLELSPDAAPSSMFVNHKGELETLPFRMSLLELKTDYEKDLFSPLGYSAAIEVSGIDGKADTLSLSMNRPMLLQRHSFCIKSVTPSGISLNVQCDPWGVPVVYFGFFMALVSFVMILFSKDGGFRRLLQRIRNNEKTMQGAAGSRTAFDKALLALTVPLFAALTLAGAYRWYVTGLFPATNGHEAMFLLAWSSLFLGMVAWRRSSYLFKAMFVFALLSLAVAMLSVGSSAAVIPPVLRTPLLGLHVSAMILAYSLLGCTAINAVVALWNKFVCNNESRFIAGAYLGRLILYPATALLAAGIFIGAVWANISWGRYWGLGP